MLEESKNLYQNLKKIQLLLNESLDLIEKNPKTKPKASQKKGAKKSSISELDFTMSSRAFIKKYSTKMSGPKKFTLLMAHLTKGDGTKSIKLAEIKKHWKKGVFGGDFNSFYSTQAKDKDWVDSKRKEEYCLRPSWKEIFN